jgi:hypothetical protein
MGELRRELVTRRKTGYKEKNWLQEKKLVIRGKIGFSRKLNGFHVNFKVGF